MNNLRLWAVGSFVLLAYSVCPAKTWTVDLNGSGDFTDIRSFENELRDLKKKR